MKVRGLVNIPLRFGNLHITVPALVLPGLNPAMIIGMDYLEAAKGNLNLGKMELDIPGLGIIKLSGSPSGMATNVHSVEVISHQSGVVWLQAPAAAAEGATIWVDNCIVRPGVYMARSVSMVKNNRVAVQVCNTSSRNAVFRPSQLLSSLCVIPPEERQIRKTTTPSGRPTVRECENVSQQLACGEPSLIRGEWYQDMAQALQVNIVQPRGQEMTVEEHLWNSLDHLSETHRQFMYKQLVKYKEMFTTDPKTLPGAARDAIGSIRSDGDPIAHVPYRTPPWKRDIIDQQVEDLIRQGLVEESVSPWAAPVVLVEKPSAKGQWRLCIDYRSLNESTTPIRWPLPRVDDTLAQLGEYKYFSTIDLAWGFWAIPLDDESKAKTAFITERGLYQWNRLPMGWQGAPATFQRATDLLLRGMSHATVLAYIDDIIVFSKTFHSHVVAVTEVCKRLHTAGRAVKLSKVHWAKEEVDFLGFRVGRGVISPIQDKVQNVLKLEDPTSTPALLSFLVAAGVYRNFLPDFATLADPLYKCEGRPETLFADRWSVECTTAVQHIRLALENMTSMVLPHGNAELALQVDCDHRGFGSVLLQRMSSAYPWMPMKFYSGVFRGPDARRSNPERVVMAVARVLKKIHPLLPYSKKIQVFTSDDAIRWALDPTEVSGRSAKAALAVNEFDVTWCKAKVKFQRFGGLFSYNSPELQARQRAAERRKVEAQQRCTQLEQCEVVTFPEAWVLTFDGGYRQKEKIGGRGWTVWSVVKDEWTLHQAAGSCKEATTTSNVEEFTGLCEALECVRHLPPRPIHAFGDSKLVIGAMQGKLNCKAPGLVPLYERAKTVAMTLPEVHFWQVSRDFNTAADWLANQSMDQRASMHMVGEESGMGLELKRLHGTSLHERIYSRPVLMQKNLPQQILVTTRAQAQARRAQSDAFGRLMPWERLRHSQLATPWIRAYMDFLEKGVVIPATDQGELAVQHFAVNDGVLWLTSSRADEEWRLVIPPKMRTDILK